MRYSVKDTDPLSQREPSTLSYHLHPTRSSKQNRDSLIPRKILSDILSLLYVGFELSNYNIYFPRFLQKILAMGYITDSFTILYVGLAAGIYLKPEYAIFNSSIVTGAVLFSFITVSRIVYQLMLYPDYFTPLKHIYSPAVGYSSLLRVR